MDIRGRQILMREIAVVSFLSDYTPQNEWRLDINDTADVVTVNDDPSDTAIFDITLRSLVWTNLSADGNNILSGALTFNHDYTYCHGTVKSGHDVEYLVEGVIDGDGELSTGQKYRDSLKSRPLSLLDPSGLEAEGVVPIKQALETLASQDLLSNDFTEAPPSYSHSELQATDADDSGPVKDIPVVEDLKSTFDARVVQENKPVSEVKMVTWRTERRLQEGAVGNEGWQSFLDLSFGKENTMVMHDLVYMGGEDITESVIPDAQGNVFSKQQDVSGTSCPWAFDIEFKGEDWERSFSGTLTNPEGTVFEWRASQYDITTVLRDGDNKRAVGSDGLSLDLLLYGITSISRERGVDEKTRERNRLVDLAQQKADFIFNRLMLDAQEEEVSDMLFGKNRTVLTPAETRILSRGPDFLRRAGLHAILQNIKSNEKVKEKTRNRIKEVQCKSFMPMCMALQPPIDPTNPDTPDPVTTYGWDRIKDGWLLSRLQGEMQAVTRACYIEGYRAAVVSIRPYLANAAEWYTRLSIALQSSVFLADWRLKAQGSAGFAKKLYDIQTKLDLLWQVAHEDERLKVQLYAQGVSPPEEIVAVLNAAGYTAALKGVQWDEDVKKNLKSFFTKLNEQTPEGAELAAEFRSLIVRSKGQEQSKAMDLKEMGEYIVELLEEARAGKQWSCSDAETQLAILQAQDIDDLNDIEDRGTDNRPKWHKGMAWRSGFMSYFRGVVMVVGVNCLMRLMTMTVDYNIDWKEKFSMAYDIGKKCYDTYVEMKESPAWAKLLPSSNGPSFASKLNKMILEPLAGMCKRLGAWIYRSLPDVGKRLFDGTKDLIRTIGNEVKSVGNKARVWAEKKVQQWAGKSLSLVMKTVMNCLLFGWSVICLFGNYRKMRDAWSGPSTKEIVVTTFEFAMAAIEVVILVVSGIAQWVGAATVVSACTGYGIVLAVVGIVFLAGLFFYEMVWPDDPLDDLIVKYGGRCGLVY